VNLTKFQIAVNCENWEMHFCLHIIFWFFFTNSAFRILPNSHIHIDVVHFHGEIGAKGVSVYREMVGERFAKRNSSLS